MIANGIYHIYNQANRDENWSCSDYLFLVPLPNHFHAMVRIKGEEGVKRIKGPALQKPEGKPFSTQYEGKEVDGDGYFTQLILYIHNVRLWNVGLSLDNHKNQ